MGIIDIVFVPWNDPAIGRAVLEITVLLFLIALLPILYFLLNKKSKITERMFNNYFNYVGIAFISLMSIEFFFWPLALLLNSLFLIGLFDKKGAAGMCYREKNGLGFRSFELNGRKCYNEYAKYTKTELKKYLPNPIAFCSLLYAFPLLMASIFHFSGLGYLFWI